MRFVCSLSFFLFCSIIAGQEVFKTGEVLDSIQAKNHPDHFFSIYLPGDYDTYRSWPIIYLFEPIGRASLAVGQYQEAADEYGVILASSYSSRNGSFEDSFRAADILMKDLEERLSIDQDQIFASGFSGGSRLSLALAVQTGKVRGVIGVGAAQPPMDQVRVSRKHDFYYVGLVGNQDMNYQEHKVLKKTLDSYGMPNALIISGFSHRWASLADFKLALAWLDKQADVVFKTSDFSDLIKQKLMIPDDSITYLDRKMMAESFGTEIESRSDKELKKLEKSALKISEKETQMRDQIGDSLLTSFRYNQRVESKIEWVSGRLERLKKAAETDKDPEDRLLNKRVVDHVRALTIETAMSLIPQGRYDEALINLELYETLTGQIIYANWMMARTCALKGDFPGSLASIKKMFDAGFINKKAFEKDQAFAEVIKTKEFEELMISMKN